MQRLRGSLFVYAIAYFVVLEVMIGTAVVYWPYFLDNIAHLQEIAAPIPILHAMLGDLEENGLAGYVLGQQFFKGCNTLGTAAAVLFAAGAVAGEAHRGTLEIWLARPYSRLRMLSERWLAGALATALPVFASTATIPLFATRVGESLDMVGLFWCAAHQSVFLLATFSTTFLFSAMGSNPTRIALGVLFFTTLQFALYMVGTVTHYSLFRLSDLDDYLRTYDDHALHAAVALPLAAVSLVGFAGAFLAFRRRVP